MRFGFCLDDVGIAARIAVECPDPVVIERVGSQAGNVSTNHVPDIQISVPWKVSDKSAARRDIQAVAGSTGYAGPVRSEATCSIISII